MSPDPEDDFEQRVRALVRGQVDARLGPQRPAPAFDAARASAEAAAARRRRRFTVLAAAACVLVLAAVAIIVAGVGTRDDTPPAEPPPSPSVAELRGARIVLPHGWVARDQKQYFGPDEGSVHEVGWCLTPASRPASTRDGACPLWLYAEGTSDALDPEGLGGFANNGHPCGGAQVGGVKPRFEGGTRTFGGRAAEWRRWAYACSPTRTARFEQYVVTSAPSWILYSERADAGVHRVIGGVVAASRLPKQSLPVRLVDRGIVRSITPGAGRTRVVIDRTAGYADYRINPTRETYTYEVPARVFSAGGKIAVGDDVRLTSDGRAVTSIERD